MAKEYFELTIVADTNDADYITEIQKITQEELEFIKPIVKKIKKFKPYTTPCSYGTRTHHHNWANGDCLREDLGEKSPQELYDLTDEEYEAFSEYLPSSEYGFHTIESIEVTPYVKKEKLL